MVKRGHATNYLMYIKRDHYVASTTMVKRGHATNYLMYSHFRTLLGILCTLNHGHMKALSTPMPTEMLLQVTYLLVVCIIDR